MSGPFTAVPSSPWSLPTEVDARLLQGARVKRLVKSEAVFPQGSEPLGMFRVIRGTLRVNSQSASGRPLFLTSLGVGDWFGEVPLLDDLPRTYDVRASSSMEVAVLPASAFWQIIEEATGCAVGYHTSGLQQIPNGAGLGRKCNPHAPARQAGHASRGHDSSLG
ncbi:cyclic nucleotide-binding domain-containing protein [Pseudomonas sp. PvP001]|uniref:cyclic nucleotide-binding domain-containing protein n=1 Tax=Pseudomonas sp. PvP001 TaxID=3158559 RepID=UPI003395FF92